MNRALLRRIETNDETLKDLRLHIRSERELRDFIAAVPYDSNIQALKITNVAMGPEVATALSTVLLRMQFLTDFMLYNCDCSNADGLSILATALANKESLDNLWLIRCRIETQGAEIIASSLGSNSTKLESLLLFGNSIGDEGAIALASLFSSSSSIMTVNLNGNNIAADGMSALAASIGDNRSVKTLFLECNIAEPNTHFKRILYNDTSIESVVSSNHTLEGICPQTSELESLLKLNQDGPEKAVQAKIVRFLDEQPTFILTMGLEGSMMPSYMEKIGRECRLNTMFELIRNVPGLLESNRRCPEQQSRKRSRS